MENKTTLKFMVGLMLIVALIFVYFFGQVTEMKEDIEYLRYGSDYLNNKFDRLERLSITHCNECFE